MDDLFYSSDSSWFGYVANGAILGCAALILAFVALVVYANIAAHRQTKSDIDALTAGIQEADRKRLLAEQANEDLKIYSRAVSEGSSRKTTFANPVPEIATPTSTSPFRPGKRRLTNGLTDS